MRREHKAEKKTHYSQLPLPSLLHTKEKALQAIHVAIIAIDPPLPIPIHAYPPLPSLQRLPPALSYASKKAKDKQEIDENDALESGILMKAPPGQLTAHVCVCLCVYRSGYVYLRTYMH
jgi:hypothetical protein